MTTDPFPEAARAEAFRAWFEDPDTIDSISALGQHMAEWARTHLAAQEESVLMTSREETISDRLSDAGYTEYAEDEDGGVTWVSAPLGEVLRIVSAAQEPTDAEVEAAALVICFEMEGPDGPSETKACKACVITARRAFRAAARAARRDEEKRAACGCDLTGMAPPAVHVVDRHKERQ